MNRSTLFCFLCLLKLTDQPLIAKSGSIEFGTIDPTNPKTRAWLKAVIKESMLADAGSSGWMAGNGLKQLPCFHIDNQEYVMGIFLASIHK